MHKKLVYRCKDVGKENNNVMKGSTFAKNN